VSSNPYTPKNLTEQQRTALHYVRTGTVYISKHFKGVAIPRRTVTVLAWDRAGRRIPDVRRASVVALLKRGLVHESPHQSRAYPEFTLIKDGPEPLNR
jgi:hypothetical protein